MMIGEKKPKASAKVKMITPIINLSNTQLKMKQKITGKKSATNKKFLKGSAALLGDQSTEISRGLRSSKTTLRSSRSSKNSFTTISGTKSSHRRSSTEIPITGSALLEWTRRRMSFISSTSSNLDSESEEEIVKKESVRKFEKKRRDTAFPMQAKLHKRRKLKISHLLEKKEDEKVEDISIRSPLEDEIMFQWRIRRSEEEKLANRKEKIEVKFDELSNLDFRRVSSGNIVAKKPKIGAKKTRKSNNALKREAEKKAFEERCEQQRRYELFQKILARQDQEKEEDVLRIERNTLTMKNMALLKNMNLERIRESVSKNEWKHYSSCTKLPLVTRSKEVIAFVQEWERNLPEMTINELSGICKVNSGLLHYLSELLFHTDFNQRDHSVDLLWIKKILCETQDKMVDKFIYKILQDIQKNMSMDNLFYASFRHKSEAFTLCIWLKLDWPVSLPNPRKPEPPKIQLEFPEMALKIVFPFSLDGKGMAVQCMYVPYDHFSESCESYKVPPEPDCVSRNLMEANQFDRLLRKKYCYESTIRAEYLEKVAKFEEANPDLKYPKSFELPEISSYDEIPEVPLKDLDPTPTQYIELADEIYYQKAKENMNIEVEEEDINLREYGIIGGIFIIHLLYQPTQPQPLVKFHMTITPILPPRELERVPFYVDIRPPPLPGKLEMNEDGGSISRSFKIIRARRLNAKYGSKFDLKKGNVLASKEIQKYKDAQEECQQMVEQEKEKMIFISLGLPSDVIYLEHPRVCLWDESYKVWTSNDVYDVNIDHQERKINFRTTRFGIVGLAVRKSLNFPYSYWNIRPNSDDSIKLVLEGFKVTMEFTIRGSNITIKSFGFRMSEFNVGNGLKNLISKTFTLQRLIKTLRWSGLDIFPDYDTSCYYSATTEKHWGMANATYFSIAKMAIAFDFSNSKWNQGVGRRTIILQAREFDASDASSILNPFNLIRVTNLKCEILSGIEDDKSLSDIPKPESKFQPNLFYQLKSMTKVTDRSRINSFSTETIYTLSQFLMRTRLFSFS